MIISLIGMSGLPNFCHIITSTKKFESADKNLLVTSWTEVMAHNLHFKNTFILRTSRWHILLTSSKFQPFSIKETVKKSKRAKRF